MIWITETKTSETIMGTRTQKGFKMKNVFLAAVVALGLGLGFAYAENQAELELEHANKLATGDDSVQEDMGNMKAKGKCNTDQSAKIKKKATKPAKKPSKSELELEHANKLATGDDSVQEDMGKMKAQGKCNTGE
jgi:uncharacterized protein HemX